MVESLRLSLPPGLPHEIILVDDGSSDGTREWLRGLGEPFRVILNERNIGFGAATNRGAAQARGRVLALLNNDLVLGRGWLQPMLGALRSLGRRAGLVGNVQFSADSLELDHAGIRINLKGKPEHDRRPPSLASLLLRPRRNVVAVTGACVVVLRETWERLGGFDEAFFNGCEDVDLCLRARRAGLRNCVALRSRVLHHVSASPGRKRRDEENTRILVERWRDELAMIASREFTWLHFRGVVREPRDFPDPVDAWRMVFFALGLTGRPPEIPLAQANAAIDVELARWRQMSSH
jgi:GT2 family glycosyltransferase